MFDFGITDNNEEAVEDEIISIKEIVTEKGDILASPIFLSHAQEYLSDEEIQYYRDRLEKDLLREKIIATKQQRQQAIDELSYKARSNPATSGLYSELMKNTSMRTIVDAWVLDANTELAFVDITKITTKKVNNALDAVVNTEVGAKQRMVIDYLKFTMAEATSYTDYQPYADWLANQKGA